MTEGSIGYGGFHGFGGSVNTGANAGATQPSISIFCCEKQKRIALSRAH
jgi:hypothetical protein